jgi:hypothetical protein
MPVLLVGPQSVLAIAEDSTVEELVLCYRLDQTSDGFAARRMVHALFVVAGVCPGGDRRVDRARRRERLLWHASLLRLSIEEIEGDSGERLGNFPQGFT